MQVLMQIKMKISWVNRQLHKGKVSSRVFGKKGNIVEQNMIDDEWCTECQTVNSEKRKLGKDCVKRLSEMVQLTLWFVRVWKLVQLRSLFFAGFIEEEDQSLFLEGNKKECQRNILVRRKGFRVCLCETNEWNIGETEVHGPTDRKYGENEKNGPTDHMFCYLTKKNIVKFGFAK